MTMEANEDQRQAFGAALERLLDDRDIGRGRLGAEIAAKLGLPNPLTQSAVSQWVAGQTEPRRAYVFAAEECLDVPAGSLSRLLGYLPVSAVAAVSVEDALAADRGLSETARRIILSVYQAETEQRGRGRG